MMRLSSIPRARSESLDHKVIAPNRARALREVMDALRLFNEVQSSLPQFALGEVDAAFVLEPAHDDCRGNPELVGEGRNFGGA